MTQVDDCLFLLELLVDKLIFTKIPCFSDKNFKTCIIFKFLQLEPFEVCNAPNNRPCGGEDKTPSKYITNFNVGKSFLFGLKKAEIDKAKTQFIIDTEVFKTLPCDCLPAKVILGKADINLSKEFTEALDDYMADQNNIGYRSVKGGFRLTNGEEITGDIMLFIRISCFGKFIVTKFHGGGLSKFLDHKPVMLTGECDPKKDLKSEKDPCTCDVSRDHVCNEAGVSDPDICHGHDPCYCIAVESETKTPVAYRDTQSYCLHVPRGARESEFEQMSTLLNGSELLVKVPKTSAVIKKLDRGATSMQRASHSPGGNCVAPCAFNQIAVEMPGQGQPETSHFAYHSEACNEATKHGKSLQNVTPPGHKKLQPNKDVYVFKVAKTVNDGNKKNKMEVELVTPKGPTKKPAIRMDSNPAQYDENDIMPKKKKKRCKKGKKQKCKF